MLGRHVRKLVVVAILGLLSAPGMAGADPKISLSPSMVTNENLYADAGLLVDEQTLAGDPGNGTGGTPTTDWVGAMGFNS